MPSRRFVHLDAILDHGFRHIGAQYHYHQEHADRQLHSNDNRQQRQPQS